jgi:choline kinase
MEIIVPAAGLSTRFPNMKPKYLLYDYKGDMMLMNALRPFREKGFRIHLGILKEHQEKYGVIEQIQHEWPDNIEYLIIDKPTRGPADTVYQILNASGLHTSEIFIKDCDSFFEHDITEGDNYVCVTKISQHEILKKLASKSFTIANNNGIITDIVEKEVVSDTFCVGGYKFSSAMLYRQAFNELNTDREVFVSDVIGRCINNMQIFTNKYITDYVDVGTAQDWFEYNDRPVIFCDIDGTIIQNQTRVGQNNYRSDPIVLEKNVKRLLELQSKGAQFIFTTARPHEYTNITKEMIDKLGFVGYDLICGLQNSKRILINDYNESNPYPRAVAINLYRNDDKLSDFL